MRVIGRLFYLWSRKVSAIFFKNFATKIDILNLIHGMEKVCLFKAIQEMVELKWSVLLEGSVNLEVQSLFTVFSLKHTVWRIWRPVVIFKSKKHIVNSVQRMLNIIWELVRVTTFSCREDARTFIWLNYGLFEVDINLSRFRFNVDRAVNSLLLGEKKYFRYNFV